MDLPQKAASVVLSAPAAAAEGSVIVVRVRADLPDGVAVRGEVALLRTIAFRYRESRGGGGTHLATARTTDVVASQNLPAHADGYDDEVLLAVPADGPASADAALVSVDWAVRTRLVSGERPPAQAVEKIQVLSGAPAFDDVIDRPPRRIDSAHAIVTLHGLSSRRIRPSARLSGTVGVQPLHPGLIRSVRLDLVVRERVLRGPEGLGDPAAGRKEEETVVASLDLAGSLVVTEDLRPLSLPFELTVPGSVPGPSIATADFELTWLLRAVVSRALHRDAAVELDLQATTLGG